MNAYGVAALTPRACVDPGSPDEHALRLYPDDPPCGKVGGEPQPATPIMWEGSAPQSQ